MKITVLGTGNVGSVLVRRLGELGHDVTTATSGTGPRSQATAVAGADVVILALPYAVATSLDPAVRDALAGKVVIDATNPLAADFMSLTVGHTTSAAEQIAATLAGARLVKAFNAVLAPNHDPAAFAGRHPLLPIAGDDAAAKKVVLDLGAELGFEAVDTGALTNARYLEPMAELLVQLAYGAGLGTGIAFALLRA